MAVGEGEGGDEATTTLNGCVDVRRGRVVVGDLEDTDDLRGGQAVSCGKCMPPVMVDADGGDGDAGSLLRGFLAEVGGAGENMPWRCETDGLCEGDGCTDGERTSLAVAVSSVVEDVIDDVV